MPPIGDDFAQNLRLAEREFQQARHAIGAATPRGGHTVEGVRGLSHAVREARGGFLVPSVAVAAAYPDSQPGERFNQLQRAGQFRGDGDLRDGVPMLQEPLPLLALRRADEIQAMRAGLLF